MEWLNPSWSSNVDLLCAGPWHQTSGHLDLCSLQHPGLLRKDTRNSFQRHSHLEIYPFDLELLSERQTTITFRTFQLIFYWKRNFEHLHFISVEVISGDESFHWISDHVDPSDIVASIFWPVNIPRVLRHKDSEKIFSFFFLSLKLLPFWKTLITPKFGHMRLVFVFIRSHLGVLNTISQMPYLNTLGNIDTGFWKLFSIRRNTFMKIYEETHVMKHIFIWIFELINWLTRLFR